MGEAERERAAVVAWLRNFAMDTSKLTQREIRSRAYVELVALSNQFANAISRGDHLEKGKP